MLLKTWCNFSYFSKHLNLFAPQLVAFRMLNQSKKYLPALFNLSDSHIDLSEQLWSWFFIFFSGLLCLLLLLLFWLLFFSCLLLWLLGLLFRDRLFWRLLLHRAWLKRYVVNFIKEILWKYVHNKRGKLKSVIFGNLVLVRTAFIRHKILFLLHLHNVSQQ